MSISAVVKIHRYVERTCREKAVECFKGVPREFTFLGLLNIML